MRIKHTKTELKAQSDALKRYERFLPMLQLKKQQLQAEIAMIDSHIDEVDHRAKQRLAAIHPWVALFSDAGLPENLVTLDRIVTESGNIAGVAIPIFKGIETHKTTPDPFESPAWHDEAQEAIEALLALRAERAVLEDQRRLIQAELLTTSQRVNLFEKIKIPECKENIRVIRIHLGDEQTAAVSRGKIAKRRDTGADDRNRREDAA